MIELLDQPADDIEALAKQALALAWDLADQRDRYCLVMDQPAVGVVTYGPANTRNELMRAIGNQIIASKEPARALIMRMLPLREEKQ